MTVIQTSTASTATAYSNQRKVGRTSNGVLHAMFWNGASGFAAPIQFWYSTDDGTTWNEGVGFGFVGTGTTYVPNASFFIDPDDRAHVVFKDRHDGNIKYRRGTPNAERTSWTWTGVTTLPGMDTSYNYPDIVAHREGTGWRAHIVASRVSGGHNYAAYWPLTITSGGTVTAGSQVTLGGTYSLTSHTYPSIDFHHTGDGQTVADDTPHLYVAWSSGTTGAGRGIRFKKATYSGGTWSWGTEREIDSTRFWTVGTGAWLNCLFDGTRVIMPGSMYDGANFDLILHERDAADTTTTTRVLVDNQTNDEAVHNGAASYDSIGNVLFLGRNDDASKALVYRKWSRSGALLSEEFVVDAGTVNPYVSAKRGHSNDFVEFIYTDGSGSPYDVTFGSIDLNNPPDAPTLTFPVNDIINRSIDNEFTWIFVDQDAGDMQSRYQIQIRNPNV